MHHKSMNNGGREQNWPAHLGDTFKRVSLNSENALLLKLCNVCYVQKISDAVQFVSSLKCLETRKTFIKIGISNGNPPFVKSYLVLIWSVSHGLSSLTIDNTYLFKDFLRIVQRSLTYLIWNNQKNRIPIWFYLATYSCQAFETEIYRILKYT